MQTQFPQVKKDAAVSSSLFFTESKGEMCHAAADLNPSSRQNGALCPPVIGRRLECCAAKSQVTFE